MAARKRKRRSAGWSYSVKRYGVSVRIFESRPGAALRWDYQEDGQRTRPEVTPRAFVRGAPDGPLDATLMRQAEDLCEQKAAALRLQPLRSETDPPTLTVGEAYRLYFEPRRRALPASREARIHHTASRAFWTQELGAETLWDRIRPGDVWGALTRLKEAGQVATAEKRFSNLNKLYTWLRDRMGYEELKNPLRTLRKADLRTGYQPRRPRYTDAEVERLVAAAPRFGERMALFVTLLADSGARAVQVRRAMRSGLDCDLEPAPPKGDAPHGWIMLPAVKGQEPMLTYLTARERRALDAALASYLAEWEAEWQGDGTDYPLVPGGRTDSRGLLNRQPITDAALRRVWPRLEKAARVPRKARRTFHGVRRAWADDIEAGEGLDTVTAAGGWSKRDTPEQLYISKRRYSHLERARRRREQGK